MHVSSKSKFLVREMQKAADLISSHTCLTKAEASSKKKPLAENKEIGPF